jgi:hypothetical protein
MKMCDYIEQMKNPGMDASLTSKPDDMLNNQELGV